MEFIYNESGEIVSGTIHSRAGKSSGNLASTEIITILEGTMTLYLLISGGAYVFYQFFYVNFCKHVYLVSLCSQDAQKTCLHFFFGFGNLAKFFFEN